ncbi:MAG: hypothetical protein KDB80_11980 [Planctomycetes bacterium]|nr:hypothetical protein [Planctomycetota bacterium]
MKAHLLATSFVSLASLLAAQDPVACYDFDSDDVVANPSTSASASDLVISNDYMFGGPWGDGWLCLSTAWNNVGGSISWTVTPAPGNTLDFTRLSWRAVTQNASMSDSVDAVDVYVDGNLVATIDPLTHLTTHSIDLSVLPDMRRRSTPVSFQLVFDGNPTGQSSYEMNDLCVEAAACVEDLASEGRIIWLNPPGSNNTTTYRVLDGVGFSENGDGTAHLVGAVVDVNDPCKRFSLDLTLSGRSDPTDPSYPPAGSPKTNWLVVNNGVDTGEWRYYQNMTGTLTGQICLQGAVLQLTRRGESFQIGEGANLKDLSFGASSWFDYTVISQADDPACFIPDGGVGDFNLTLGNDCICIGGDPASVTYYGAGLPGCAGVPEFEFLDRPLTSSEMRIRIGNNGTQTMVCGVLWSFAPDDLYIDLLGGNILISLAQYITTTPIAVPPGGVIFPCHFGDDACSSELTFYAQTWCIDPCGPRGLASSVGAQVDIGDV